MLTLWSIEQWKLLYKSTLRSNWSAVAKLAWGRGLRTRWARPYTPGDLRRPHYASQVLWRFISRVHFQEYLKVAREKLFVLVSRFVEGSYGWGAEFSRSYRERGKENRSSITEYFQKTVWNGKPWATWTIRYHDIHSAGWMLFLFLFVQNQIR